MAVYQGFIGGMGTVRSRNVNAEDLYNWYPEVPPGTAKVPMWLVPTPGVTPFAVLGNGPVRGLLQVNGRVFAVGGAGFYEVFAGGTSTYWGPVATNAQPASLSTNGTNGNQVFIVSGGSGYIFNLSTNTLSLIADADFPSPCVMGAFSDGYFLALKGQSNQFQISALYDGTDWDILDTFQVSTVAEEIVTMIESHREIWLLGQQTSSVWANTGDLDTVYQPIGGVKIDMGSAAPFGAARIDNAIIWLGQSELGTRMVFRANGYTPQRVSTHAIEYELSKCPRLSDAIAWAYQEEGHSFYCLYLPEADTTLCYDVATNLWHRRALWDSVFLRWEPHPGRCAAFGFGRNLVGDRSSGGIYEMRLGLGTDTVVSEILAAAAAVAVSPPVAAPPVVDPGPGGEGGVIVTPPSGGGNAPPDPGGGSTPPPAPSIDVTLSVADAATTEGDDADIVIALSAVWTEDVTLTYQTANGTALAGTDYTAVSGSDTILAGDATLTVPVTTILRAGYNGPRQFTFTVTSAVGGPNNSALTVTDGTAVVTIGDTTAPTIPVGANGYFDTLVGLDYHYASYSLRESSQLARPADGGYANSNSQPLAVTYSPSTDTNPEAQDAAKVVIPAFSVMTTKLVSALDASSLTVALSNATGDVTKVSTGINVKGMQLKIDDEIVIADTVSFPLNLTTGIYTLSARGAYGTTATTHAANTNIWRAGNSLGNQVRVPLGLTDGSTWLLTWDGYWTTSYVGTGINNHKAFQLSSGGDSIWLEPQTRFDGGANTPPGWNPATDVAALEVRSYNTVGGPASWADSTGNQLGPGITDNQPIEPMDGTFILKPSTWTRFWVRIQQRANDYDLMDYWVADENNAAVQIYDSVPISVRITGTPPNTIAKFWLEFNTSTAILPAGRIANGFEDLVAYVKNIVVLRNPTANISGLLIQPEADD